MKRHFLRVVFALTLPFGLFWSIGILLDGPISQELGWEAFFLLCAAGSVALTVGVAAFVPAWLRPPSQIPLRTILVWLLLGSAVIYLSLVILLGLGLELLAPPDEHKWLVALWIPLWWMLPLGALVSSRMARRPTNNWS